MIRARKLTAVGALLGLAVLIFSTSPTAPGGGYSRVGLAMWFLLLPLLFTVAGLLREWAWGRWLGLATGIAVLPWAMALVVGPAYGMPLWPRLLALAASLLLLVSLTGRAMFERYEGSARSQDWSGRRMGLVRWTIICNLASMLGLYVFVAAYEYAIEWHLLIPAALLLGLVGGLLMLARQRTVGILVVALCCILFVPAGAYFVVAEARAPEEAILFVAMFLPGVLTGWATLFVFGRLMWRFLRAG